MTTQNQGIKLALLTALISGISIFINKFAVTAIQPALTFTATKNTIVALMIIAFLLISKKWQLFFKLNKDQMIKLSLIGLIGGALPFYLFFTGLTAIPAINAAIIQKTLVIWVAILALPFLKEKLSSLQLLAVAILFGSNVMIGGFKGFTFSIGELMVLGATILWAIENVIAKKVLASVDSDIVTFARMGIGSILLLTASLISNPQSFTKIASLTQTQWFWLLLTALALFAYVSTWYQALAKAPAVLVTAILVSSTLVTNILTAIFTTHTWNQNLTIQGSLLVLGLFIFLKFSKAKFKNEDIINKVNI